MIIWYKDNLSFIYNIRESLRDEIQQEMRRTRLDKGRLYDLLLRIAESSAGAGAGAEGPAGPQGPAGPAGPAGECKCKCTKEEAPKKTTTATKKKTTTTATKKTTA